ncbi:hypothetical protein J2Y69_001608 [Microbacterium resistens]|uniref:ATP-dependent endonuclease n=1 Tax=Microbacterium resistens TaxID=156977 RepID=A0ABU1SBL4_9MICO|nr:ATP-dependent endonuclease [Microbacterium resistens]MDR6867009.1 hypothetical protein [Microbacterium resistens]
MSAVVLVEGESDRRALDAAARVRGVVVEAERIVLGGITNLRSALESPRLSGRPVLGLYDTAERRYVLGALAAVGRDPSPGSGDRGEEAALEAIGFFGCDRDLEDEAIRAAGAELVLRTLRDRSELALFRVFQGQPAQRDRPLDAQLHRFAGTASGRKVRFAADVIAALQPDELPGPLDRLLDALTA